MVSTDSQLICSECAASFPSAEAEPGPKGFRCKACTDAHYKSFQGQRMGKYGFAIAAIAIGVVLIGVAGASVLFQTASIKSILLVFVCGVVSAAYGADLFSKTRPRRR